MNDMDVATQHQAKLEGKCGGKDECTAKACDEFWGTSPSCEPGDKIGMWIDFKYRYILS